MPNISDAIEKEKLEKPIITIEVHVDYGTHENVERYTLEGFAKLIKPHLDSIQNCECTKK